MPLTPTWLICAPHAQLFFKSEVVGTLKHCSCTSAWAFVTLMFPHVRSSMHSHALALTLVPFASVVPAYDTGINRWPVWFSNEPPGDVLPTSILTLALDLILVWTTSALHRAIFFVLAASEPGTISTWWARTTGVHNLRQTSTLSHYFWHDHLVGNYIPWWFYSNISVTKITLLLLYNALELTNNALLAVTWWRSHVI